MTTLWQKARWLIPLIFLTVTTIGAILLATIAGNNPILYLRIDLANLLLLIGLTLTLIAYLTLWLITRFHHQKQHLTHQATAERLRFLRRLDHELKNPLTAIHAGIANAHEAPDTPTQQEALLSIKSQTLRLGRLSADLRKLAELETRPLDRTTVNLTTLLQETFDLIQETAGQRQLSLSIPQAPWPLPQISGDPDLLFLAIYNLLENAVKFTRPTDRIEVRAFEDGNRVVIEIADTGAGIPADEQPHIWAELYRGKRARGIPGSGLGLALVRAVVERHGGQLHLRSRMGQGSVFTIRLLLNT